MFTVPQSLESQREKTNWMGWRIWGRAKQFENRKSTDDLERAFGMDITAVQATLQDTLNSMTWLRNLAGWLERSYWVRRTGRVAKQLNDYAAVEVLTLPSTELELGERATAASMLLKPFKDDETRVKVVRILISAADKKCGRQRHRRPRA
ncbi:hypothetical protein PSPO01_16366 [Paraphaeosphaeria sporulosa]